MTFLPDGRLVIRASVQIKKGEPVTRSLVEVVNKFWSWFGELCGDFGEISNFSYFDKLGGALWFIIRVWPPWVHEFMKACQQDQNYNVEIGLQTNSNFKLL